MGTALIASIFVASQANAMAPRVEVQAASEPPSDTAQPLESEARSPQPAAQGAQPNTEDPNPASSSAAPSLPPPGLDPATAGSIRERYGDLLLSPADEDTARAVFAWGKVRFEGAEGIWARLHPPEGELVSDPDSTFLIDYMNGIELLESAETEQDERRMIRLFEEARAAFDAVLAKDARNREALDHLVLCLERLAETYESASLYRDAEELYRNLIAHQDLSNWYYRYRLMLVLDRLGRSYDALEAGFEAEDLLLQQVAGILPASAGSGLGRAEAIKAREAILRSRWSIEQRLGLFDAMLITANRLDATSAKGKSASTSALSIEYGLAMAFDPQGRGHEGYYRHLELLRAYNGERHQDAYLGWQALREDTVGEGARIVLDYYLALVERNHLGLAGEALRRLFYWWDRYRDRQPELAGLGASYLKNEDHPDGTYLLEDFGAACEAKGRALLDTDRALALAYFKQSADVLWSRRAAAAYNAAALLPGELGEGFLLAARRDLFLDLDPSAPPGSAPLAEEQRAALRRIAPKVYEGLLLLARREGRHSWIDPLREEIAQIEAGGDLSPRFDPGSGERGQG